jgi:geranylgeranylglycerol-phosphate geranylgeranyltransferase
VTTALPYPPCHPGFWRAYWVTLRPYLFFISGTSGLVGLALGGPLGPVAFGAALLAFSASYGLGQALTDVFQTDTDSLSAPYRPLVRGEITGRSVLVVSLVGLAACIAVFGWLSPVTLLLGGLGVVGLLLYTPAKRRFWAGPFWNSWVVGLLPVMGLLCASHSATTAILHPGLTWAALSTLLTYACFVILGYFKDVEADRATGYATLPVRFGRPVSALVSASSCALGIACSARLLDVADAKLGPSSGAGVWAAGALLLLLAHARIVHTTRDDDAHPAIAMVVRGFVLLRLGEVSLLRPELTPPALALYALFEVALFRRPCRTQV